jgi:hypothetical protein
MDTYDIWSITIGGIFLLILLRLFHLSKKETDLEEELYILTQQGKRGTEIKKKIQKLNREHWILLVLLVALGVYSWYRTSILIEATKALLVK